MPESGSRAEGDADLVGEIASLRALVRQAERDHAVLEAGCDQWVARADHAEAALLAAKQSAGTHRKAAQDYKRWLEGAEQKLAAAQEERDTAHRAREKWIEKHQDAESQVSELKEALGELIRVVEDDLDPDRAEIEVYAALRKARAALSDEARGGA